jgi:cytochrome c-type biogenesis protein CcmH
MSRTVRRWLPWMMVVAALAVALAIGARSGGRPTLDQRVHHIAAQIKCPVCEGQSAADSDSAPSRAIREDIRQRLLLGQSDRQILDYLVGRYPGSKLLPDARGVGLIVWVLPVLAVLGAGVALGLAFARWRSRPSEAVTPEDRALVEQALRR